MIEVCKRGRVRRRGEEVEREDRLGGVQGMRGESGGRAVEAEVLVGIPPAADVDRQVVHDPMLPFLYGR